MSFKTILKVIYHFLFGFSFEKLVLVLKSQPRREVCALPFLNLNSTQLTSEAFSFILCRSSAIHHSGMNFPSINTLISAIVPLFRVSSLSHFLFYFLAYIAFPKPPCSTLLFSFLLLLLIHLILVWREDVAASRVRMT